MLRLLVTEGENDLNKAVIRRDLAEVKRILHRIVNRSWKCCERSRRSGTRTLCPLELALGWSAGMRALLDNGVSPIHALEAALLRKDLDSSQLLVSYRWDLGSYDRLYRRIPIGITARSTNQEIRMKMIEHLTKTNRPNLDEFLEIFSTSANEDLVTDQQQKENRLSFLTEQYDCGLREIYINDPAHGSMLLDFCVKIGIYRFDPMYLLTVTRWLLERGAQPVSDRPGYAPNILHALATCVFWMIRNESKMDPVT